MARGDAQEGKWRGNWRMEWVASTLHTISEHGVSSITTADAHTSAASSRLTWRPRRFKWTRPFRRKKKSGFCACGITFQLASTNTIRPDHASAHVWCVWCAVGVRFWSCEFATNSDPCATLHGCSRQGFTARGRPRNHYETLYLLQKHLLCSVSLTGSFCCPEDILKRAVLCFCQEPVLEARSRN